MVGEGGEERVYIFYILLLESVRVLTVRGFYCIYVVGFN